MDVSDGIAALSVVIAVASVVTAVIYGRGQKQAAVRSADESRRSADAAERVARIEEGRRPDELAEAKRLRTDFDLEPAGGGQYLLRNIGTDTAFDVRIDYGGTSAADAPERFASIGSRDAESLYLARAYGTADHIVVSWCTESSASDTPRSKKLHIR